MILANYFPIEDLESLEYEENYLLFFFFKWILNWSASSFDWIAFCCASNEIKGENESVFFPMETETNEK